MFESSREKKRREAEEAAAAGDAAERNKGRKQGPPPLPAGTKIVQRDTFVDTTMLTTMAMSTLSGMKNSEKFSFSRAERFPSASKKFANELSRSKSSPAWSAHTSTTASEAGGLLEPSIDFTSAGPSCLLSAEPSCVLSAPETSVQEAARPSSRGNVTVTASVDYVEGEDFNEGLESPHVRHPPPPATDKLCAPRIDGSSMRLGEPKQRAAHPLGRIYDPVHTIGPGASWSVHRSPQWSFGGGTILSPNSTKKDQATSSTKKTKMARMALTMMDLKDAIKSPLKPQAPLSRGFGTQARMQLKGGPMELPISPGPAAYEMMRQSDPEPVWLVKGGKKAHWSKRTSGRADLSFKSGNPPNLGPGGSTEDFSFKASGPTHVFGHPLNEIEQVDLIGTDPAKYNLGSTLCKDHSPVYTVGKGQRPDIMRPTLGPGPGAYEPQDEGFMPDVHAYSFTKATRVHESDLIDPDEPPGPGAHTVRKDPKLSDFSAMPKEIRNKPLLKSTTPGPGDTFKGELPSTLDRRGRSVGVLLPRPKEITPGPGTFGEDVAAMDRLCYSSAPSWGSLGNRSSVRKPPWAEKEPETQLKMKCGEKPLLTGTVDFVSSGPKWSLMPKRKELKQDLPLQADSEAMVVQTSLG